MAGDFGDRQFAVVPDAKAYLSYLVQVNALDRQLAGVMLAGVSDNSLTSAAGQGQG